MPIIKFQCNSCGLLQRRRTKEQSIDCSCGKTVFAEGSPSQTSVGFTSEVEGHMKVQTSGVESFDLNFDRVIGEESKQKWDVIYKRQRNKWDLLQNKPSSTGYDIMRLPDGNYDSLPSQAQVFREKRQETMRQIKTQNSNNKE